MPTIYSFQLIYQLKPLSISQDIIIWVFFIKNLGKGMEQPLIIYAVNYNSSLSLQQINLINGNHLISAILIRLCYLKHL